MEAMAEVIQAKLDPRSPALALAAYAGEYGERIVAMEEGKLYYRRGSRPRTALIPLGGHRFAFDNDPSVIVEFAVAGAAPSAIELLAAGGPSQGRYARTR